MPFPNLEGKHAHMSYVEPRDFIERLRRLGRWQDFDPVVGAVLVYSPSLLQRILEREKHRPHPGLQGQFHLVTRGESTVALSGGFGIGAPAATVIMEDLIALGVRRFISIGSAGGLQPDLGIGDIVVCLQAIRDEGVSHHYLAPGRVVHTSAPLTARLQDAFGRLGARVKVGTSWTIDAPYRETIEEIRRYQAEGVLTVEMEAAALAAVAEYRGVEFASAFTISDSLSAEEWNPQFWAEETARGLDLLHEAAVTTLIESGTTVHLFSQ